MIHILPTASILFIFSLQLRQAYASLQVTIKDTDAYVQQHSCVQGCLWGGDDLSLKLGCPSPWLEECYCRRNSAPDASSFLTSCVDTRCTSPVGKVPSAVSVYDQYCSSTQPGPATNPATTTSPGFSIPEPSSTVLVVVTTTNPPSSTSASTSASPQNGGEFLRNSILIGIVVALHLSLAAGYFTR